MHYEVIIDEGETPNKCTVAPLLYRKDFRLFWVADRKPLGPLLAPILLHHEGECITRYRNLELPVQGIACIDCVWRKLNILIEKVTGPRPTFARIPEGFRSAYPRQSANNSDPAGGLATIEAIFTAAAILGNWDLSLLSEYYFGAQFVELNRQQFIKLGVAEAADPKALPVLSPRNRSSVQRKHDRRQIRG
ncbi:MAG: hypothetical protein A2070_03580 [Bdellovibrionales bacterium GWC1_52_8]|nr:MAG: hypothetical protein A2Z97_05265 [Bdellovibrionales bacterium GWB1_52_6]OFZ04598.1 MAG: hypothetical protein A2X97_13340 [Bdellovibrionales bacterium GWA1_52_35]OFZ32809.1 MAG: hypothetical protein A2070_03580 [Bdellovibrionales bacterium GWC1_52_8]HCM40011.1 hypothetical protein [Bdellovibrionales bacterium]